MTILPKKNKNREQCEQESAAHGHGHGVPRETHMSTTGIPGPSIHHIPVHNRPGTQAAAAADTRKPPGYAATSRSLPAAALDEKIAATKEGSSSDLESGPSQSKRRLRSPPAASLRSRKQGRAPAAVKPSATAASSDSDDSNAGGYNSEDEYGPPAYQDNIEELEIRFEKTMKEKMGLCIKPMVPDGACLFRAVADQVYGDQDMHGVVRKHCIDYMRKNSDHFSAYVTEDFASYLDRKQTDSCHGNHVEMQAMSELYNRPVEVYQYSTKPINIYHGDYKVDLHFPIRISYHRNVHYNSLVDPYKATVGVGLGLPEFQPGLADKNLMTDATRQSEAVHIEETMLQDKIRETDWELTDEALQEQVARESYLQWLRDNEKRARGSDGAESASKSTCTSSAAAAATATTSSTLSPGEECGCAVNWLEDLAGRHSPPSLPTAAQLPPVGSCTLARQQQLPQEQQLSSLVPTVKALCTRSTAMTSPRVNGGSSSSDSISVAGTGLGPSSTTIAPGYRPAGSDAAAVNSVKDLTSLVPVHDTSASGGYASTFTFSETASSMNDMPPEVLGVTDDWADDALLAQVIAQSAQEYMDSLKRSLPPGGTTNSSDETDASSGDGC